MPFCPSCKYEYIVGIKTCPDCDIDLVDELPDEMPEEDIQSEEDTQDQECRREDVPGEVTVGLPDEPIFSGELVPVISTTDQEEADIIAAMLTGSGVFVESRSDSPSTIMEAYEDVETALYVYESQRDEANRILDESEEAEE
jgi:hypothetical protein